MSKISRPFPFLKFRCFSATIRFISVIQATERYRAARDVSTATPMTCDVDVP
jgi:hypothetical protein